MSTTRSVAWFCFTSLVLNDHAGCQIRVAASDDGRRSSISPRVPLPSRARQSPPSGTAWKTNGNAIDSISEVGIRDDQIETKLSAPLSNNLSDIGVPFGDKSATMGKWDDNESAGFAVVIPEHAVEHLSDTEYRHAVMKTSATMICAGLFGTFLMATKGQPTGYEFFAGYLVEQALSVDNLFVFIMLFDYFHVPRNLQSRVLSWGIAGAVLLRGIMIAVGVAAIQRFKIFILGFAGILLASSIKLLTDSHDLEHKPNMDGNVIMRFTKALLPNTSSEFHGEKFFVLGEQGKISATPLLLCLLCVELSDFVFAVDSIPAVLGVSKDPMVVYASNIFAIMSLRSLYTIVAKAVTDLHYLRPAVALVLGFVALKMIAEYFHLHIGTDFSLAVVCSLLGGGIGASMLENRRNALYASASATGLHKRHTPI